MKKKGLLIALIVISLLLIVLIISKNYKEKGTFKELVLDKYLDAAVEKEFDILRINKDLNGGESIYKKINDINKINELLSKFNEYELIEYNGRIPQGKRYDDYYNIQFENSHYMERIRISIEGDKDIWITIETLVITEDKKTKTTTFKHKGTSKRYEITNTSIDMDYLDKFLDSLNE